MSQCPVCKLSNIQISQEHGYTNIDCLRCGKYLIDTDMIRLYFNAEPTNENWLVSYWIRKNQGTQSSLEIDYDCVKKISRDVTFPKVNEQVENVILFLGYKLKSPSEKLEFVFSNLIPVVGTTNLEGVEYILDHLESNGLIYYKSVDPIAETSFGYGNIGLTFRGWEEYDRLQKGKSDSHLAFMAMKYDTALETIYQDHIKPAVLATGFDIRQIKERPQAGLIDNLMRTEIRKSRFLIADLTHDNNGTYWEAGYAEGLGKPVIYMCERKKFDKLKTHFDTNHHTTVLWEEDTIAQDMEQLKATIRYTFPFDSKMEG